MAETSRIHEFLRMNPLDFTASRIIADLKNSVEKLEKVFEVIHVVDVERVELEAYQLIGVV